MSRLFAVLFVFVISLAGVALLLSPIAAQADELTPTPEYQLNSEGDEWVLVDPGAAAPVVPDPQPLSASQEAGLPVVGQPDYMPPADFELMVALDQARNAGPQAVLAFLAVQPDPSLPLLQAAALDAQDELALVSADTPSNPQAVLRVSINSGPCSYATIPAAVAAAVNGSVIRVAAGTYTETVDVIGKQITIEGGYDDACGALLTGGKSTIDVASTSVVDVASGSVLTLRNLILTGGTSFGAGIDLLGSSRVTLFNTDVYSNTGASGGGAYVGSGSVITLTNDSDISENSGTSGGGAIVYGLLVGAETNSDIASNIATNGGGIYVAGGTARLSNSDVVANTATNNGGGIFVTGGLVELSNSSFIGESSPCCQTALNGAGIYADNSRIVMLGGNSTVLQNTASNNGGGIYLTNHSSLTASAGNNVGYDVQAVNGNRAVLGAGVYAITSTVNFSGRMINNIASNSGGGLYADRSTITMTGATIGGLGANQHNQIGATGLNGAGLYLINNTHAIFDNTKLISNTMSNASTGYGGGLYVRAGSAITLTNSRIEQHSLPSAFDGRGAAMYIYDASVTLSNTHVLSNTTQNLGGGVRMFGSSTLKVLSGSSFVNNRAMGGVGGAIAATNSPAIRATNAIFRSNYSSSHGGAIYQDAGTLDINGWFDIRFNIAAGNGGALAVVGTADADLAVTAGPADSFLALNTAAGNGGALFIGNADPVTLHATAGYLLALNSNHAGGHGGAAFAANGAFFDVYGNLQATSNTANGNGGVFYLGGGSRLWMDDYFSTRPQILVNTADNGGAIYASNSPRVECDGVDFGFSNNGNKATSGSGGAVFLSGSTFTADNCTFRNNQAQAGNGGAVAAYTSTLSIDVDYPALVDARIEQNDRSGPLVPEATACDPRLTQCSVLTSNRAISSTVSNGNGGAIFTSGSTLALANTYLHRNLGVRGGAIYQEGAASKGNIANTLVYSNTSKLSFGAGIRVAGGAMTVTQSTLAYNIGGAGYSPGAVQSHISNSIIWGNSSAAFGALTTAVCNIDQGGTAGPATNPRFLAPGGGENFLLLPGSPAIDACTTGLARDLLGFARPIGLRFDMGAFEAYPTVYLPVMVR